MGRLYDARLNKSNPRGGEGGCDGGGNSLVTIVFAFTVRSSLIPSPPTYNLAHDYISWESFSNVSYYTRVLPSVPQDCPTPMGTKGNGGRVRGWGSQEMLSSPL